jgi:MFS transporter, PPP family, 3-phenylpropionic acid transporter
MSALRLRLVFAVYGMAIGFLIPFLAPLLAAHGMRPEAIGLVLGASAVVSLISYPIWGLLADGAIGREGTLAITGLLGVGGGLAILFAGTDAVVLGVAVTAASFGIAPWGPVTDALALQVLGPGASSFGRFRLWASAGWAAAAMVGGLLYTFVGSWTVVVGFTLGAVALSAAALRGRGTLARVRPRRAALHPFRPRELRVAIDLARPRARRVAVAASPVLLPFLVAIFLEALGNGAAGSFMSLGILDRGGDAVLIGFAFAVPALVEIPFFSSSSWLTGRFGLRALFVIGTAAGAILLAVVAVVPEPAIMATARSVDGAAYALRTASIVLIVGACLPARLRTVGQSLVWLVAGGIAPILGGPLGGIVYGNWGVRALFVTCALAVAAGAAVGYRVLGSPAWRRTASTPPTAPEAAST